MHALPAHIGDYTDFFTSQYHALNAGRVFQPDNPMLPNFKWLPIGYHGRSSSIAISGSGFPSAVGSGAGTGCHGAGLRTHAAPRLRTRAGRLHRCGQPARRADRHRRGRGPCVRTVPAQRLVGARRAGLGSGAAGAVPRQELLHHDLAMDRDAGGARAISLPAAARDRRPRVPAWPVASNRTPGRRARHRAGGAPGDAPGRAATARC